MRRLFLLAVALPGLASAQFVLPNTSPQTQNFNDMNNAAAAALPPGFVVSGGVVFSAGTAATTVAYGTTGTGVVSSGSPGGTVNWADGVTATSIDRALGFLSTGSFTSPRNIMLQLLNSTGGTITSLSVSFDYEKYRSGIRAWDLRFFGGTDGSAWTSFSTGDQTYPADGGNTVVNPATTQSKTVTITGLSIPANGNYYLRWEYAGLAGSTNAQGLGLDNLVITATTATPVPTVSTGGVSTLTGFSYTVGNGPSTPQQFTVTGTNLTSPARVTPGTSNYELATALAGPYQTTELVLPEASGGVNQTVYVRLIAGLVQGNYTDNLAVSATGATTQNVSLSGQVTAAGPPPFTAGNLAVYRVGDGAAALTSSATPGFVDEYTTAGVLVRSLTMPTAISGTNRRCTHSGTATSEGLLTRSGEGSHLFVAGYDADPGTAGVSSSTGATVNRVVARIAMSGSIDVTTALSDFASTSNPRCAYSNDGAAAWAVGGAGGVRHATVGTVGSSTSVSNTVTNARAVAAFGGQLYMSSVSGSFRLGTIGTGLPITGGQTATPLPGFPSTGSPYQFFFADLDAGVAGVDVLYVADDGASGLQKYSLVGGTWTSNGNLAVAGNGLRGLTGVVASGSVTLYGVTPGNLLSFTDANGYNLPPSGSFITLASAPTNTAFRGVALAPASSPMPVRFGAFHANEINGEVHLRWTNETESTVKHYDLERSADGRRWSSLARLLPKINNGSAATYQWVDALPLAGENHYRVRAVEESGLVTASLALRITTNKRGLALSVSPNPVQGTTVLVSLNGMPVGRYRMQMVSVQGRIVQDAWLSHPGGTAVHPLPVPALPAGVYLLRMVGIHPLQCRVVVQ